MAEVERLTPEQRPLEGVLQLDQGTAAQYIDQLTELANLIPSVDYTPEMLMAGVKSDGRILRDKWLHSFVWLDDNAASGFVMGYRRTAETNDLYPVESLYMSELAVASSHRRRGIASRLVTAFLRSGLASDVEHFTLQTNSASWNAPVRDFYTRYGFITDGTKQYDDSCDVIMRADRDVIQKAIREDH